MSDSKICQPARVLVADPPWTFQDSLPGVGRGSAKHYGCLSAAEICSFQIPEMEPVSLLFLWRVAAMQEEALEVCRAWGFKPKAELVWIKLTKHGKRHFGMGHYVRAGHESCLIAVRGSGSRLIRSHKVRSVFEAPVGLHSTKPDEFYEIVEKLSTGPYHELFARRQREGWVCEGDELEDAAGRRAPLCGNITPC